MRNVSSSTTPTLHWDRFPNARSREEHERLQLMEAAFDRSTVPQLDRLGVAPGWRCLEVGAGAGSIAAWLAERAGPAHVVATELNTDFLAPLRQLGVRVERHDITADPPVGTDFDLIHARLVLEHLQARQDVLARLVTWLRPGGWLLIEEASLVPAAAARPVVERVGRAVIDVLASTVGTDVTWARTLPLPLEDAGLVEVDAAVSSQVLRGGNALAAVFLATVRATTPALLPSGLVSRSDLDEFADLLGDPSFVDHTLTLVAAWGRRPAEQ